MFDIEKDIRFPSGHDIVYKEILKTLPSLNVGDSFLVNSDMLDDLYNESVRINRSKSFERYKTSYCIKLNCKFKNYKNKSFKARVVVVGIRIWRIKHIKRDDKKRREEL